MSAFSVGLVYRSAVSTIQRETIWYVSMFVSEGLYLHIYFLKFQQNQQNYLFRTGEKILQRFRSFCVKWLSKYQEITVQSNNWIEYSLDIA